MTFEQNRPYTRDELNALLGGNVNFFLPTKGGKPLYGCFRKEVNPRLPDLVYVISGSQRERAARDAVLSRIPFPVFEQVESETWQYIGDFLATDYRPRAVVPSLPDENAEGEPLAGVLILKKFEE